MTDKQIIHAFDAATSLGHAVASRARSSAFQIVVEACFAQPVDLELLV